MFLFIIIIIILGVSLADDPLRPQYHLMPPTNWLNDPNGPVYYGGYYHMFYQYYPNVNPGDQKQWGHCYSTDMVHWIRLPVALVPDQPYDTNGVWTGSTSIVNGTPVIIYTGITTDHRQVQCQARPTNLSDPLLTNWTKLSANPLITSPNGRDPATAFVDNENNYYLIYGYGTDELGGQAVLFTSKDFINWTYLHPIHSNHYDGFWECPDIFFISNYTVLKASLRGHDFWALGYIDPIEMVFIPVNHDLGEWSQLIDNGKFYASKTFYDPINRQQVVVGWIPEDDNRADQRGWQGLLTLPRAIFLSNNSQEIRTRPVDTVKTLRDPDSHRQYQDIQFEGTTPFELLPNLIGNQFEVLVRWEFPLNQTLDFGLIVLSTPDGTQQTSIHLITINNTNLIMFWDLPGWDYDRAPNITDWSDCQLSCEKDNRCQSWSFDLSLPINNNCFLKTGVPLLVSKSVTISGIKQRDNPSQPVWITIDRALSQRNPSAASSTLYGVIWLEFASINNQTASVELDVFVDHSAIEVFEPAYGRIAITGRVYPEDENANNVAIFASEIPANKERIVVKSVDFWQMNSIFF